jgi:hypothetical protein
MNVEKINVSKYGMQCGTIFSLILGRIDLRGNFSTRRAGQNEKLKPLKYSPTLFIHMSRRKCMDNVR